jgi:DNA (cytosine-5)-methyltransferase 1
MSKHFQAPRVVEIFSGAGLFGLAFKQRGFNLADAVEIDKTAVATYAKNLGNHVRCADVTRTQPLSECEVLLAGPPCQGFSTLGRRKSDDPRNQLSLEVVRWARALKPKVVVIENVPQFLLSEHWRRVKRQLENLGFRVDSFVLNALDYGCPQLRRRSFTIANSNGIEVVEPRKRQGLTTVREAWEGLPGIPNGKNHHVAPQPSPLALRRMRLIPPGGDRRDVLRSAPDLAPPSWRRLNCQVTDAWGRMYWDAPCNTLRTALQNPSKGRYIHPERHRVVSLREAARLHTIPDSWQFAGLPTQVARQIGNSVPLALGRAVAKTVLMLL